MMCLGVKPSSASGNSRTKVGSLPRCASTSTGNEQRPDLPLEVISMQRRAGSKLLVIQLIRTGYITKKFPVHILNFRMSSIVIIVIPGGKVGFGWVVSVSTPRYSPSTQIGGPKD